MIKSIFIVDKQNNTLIFLGILAKDLSVEKLDLSEILGDIVSQTKNMGQNSFDSIDIKERSYVFGNFNRLLIIAQYQELDDSIKQILEKIKEEFLLRYSNLLKDYTNDDIPRFKTFISNVKEIIKNTSQTQSAKRSNRSEQTESQSKQEDSIAEVPQRELTSENIGDESLIEPMKREGYPEGIPDYKRDEVLWEESQMVKNEYVAEFVEGMVFHLKVFLSISLTHHYTVFIEFSEYPKKPKLEISDLLEEELGKDLDELLYIYRNWDAKVPPHIIEVVRELEAVLMKFKAWGKLSDTNPTPESALPELEPLPDLPPLEEEEQEEEIEEETQSEEKSHEGSLTDKERPKARNRQKKNAEKEKK
ncbi:MAG: hypothetical protein R6U96_11665 [Promethearchaeia archaeon]